MDSDKHRRRKLKAGTQNITMSSIIDKWWGSGCYRLTATCIYDDQDGIHEWPVADLGMHHAGSERYLHVLMRRNPHPGCSEAFGSLGDGRLRFEHVAYADDEQGCIRAMLKRKSS